jgi:hypothetical protein
VCHDFLPDTRSAIQKTLAISTQAFLGERT